MNKKLILASLLCLGALVGCGGGDNPATSTPESNNNPGTSEVVPGTDETDPDSGEVNYGTVDAPISLKDARAIIATLQETEAGKGKTKYLTENTIYTKGVVSKIEMGNHGWKATIKDGNEELGIYYGKTKAGLPDPVVGDEVVVSGLGQNYAGTYQLVAQKVGEDFVGPTFEAITGKGEVTPDTPDNPGDTSNFGTVDAPISLKNARAIIATLQETEAGKGKTKYLTEQTIYTKGVVSKIEMGTHGWKATIKDGNEELGIYYGKTKAGLPDPVVGDEVIVSGLGQNYAGTYQLVAQKVGEDFVGPTFEAITGKGEVTPDTPVTPENPNATKATMQYTGGVTTNFTGEGNEASKVGLDANLFTLTASAGDKINTYQGNIPLFPGLNKHDEIRVYEEGGKDHGINVTIVDGYVIDSVTVTFGKYNEGTPAIRVGDTTVSLTSGKYLINNQSFFIGNDGATQVQMKTIVIEYHAK